MAADARVICDSAALREGGTGVRFEVEHAGALQPAFVIRFGGRVRAFLNRCAHRPMELDWVPGRFFSAEGDLILCATHGAAYDPAGGACRGGPCDGAGLTAIAVVEVDGRVCLAESAVAPATSRTAGLPPGSKTD